MSDLRNRVSEIMTEGFTVQVPEKIKEAGNSVVSSVGSAMGEVAKNSKETKDIITNYTEIELANAEVNRQQHKMLMEERIKRLDEERKAEEEARKKALADAEKNRQMLLSIASQAFNGMNNAVSIWASESLNLFGKLTGTVGGFSSLFDLAVPGLGSVVSAGTSLLSNLFGQAEEPTTTEETAISELATTAANRPSATVTRTGPEVQNNYINVAVTAPWGSQSTWIEGDLIPAIKNIGAQTA